MVLTTDDTDVHGWDCLCLEAIRAVRVMRGDSFAESPRECFSQRSKDVCSHARAADMSVPTRGLREIAWRARWPLRAVYAMYLQESIRLE